MFHVSRLRPTMIGGTKLTALAINSFILRHLQDGLGRRTLPQPDLKRVWRYVVLLANRL